MSLIKCPECAKDVSDQAESCPNCGYPIQRDLGVNPTPAGVNDLDGLVRKTLLDEGKIAAIKLYRERKPGVGLSEAKQQVERIEAGTAPGLRSRAKPGGCLGLFVAVIVVVGRLLVTWLRG